MATLKRRGGFYHARVYIPADLAPFVGRTEIARSLQTDNHREALDRAAVWQGRLAGLWAVVRRHPDTMDRDQIDKLADRYLQALLCEAEDFIADAHPDDFQDDGVHVGRDAWQDKLSDQIEETEAALRFNRLGSVEEAARSLLKGATGKPSEADFRVLCRRLLEARREALWAELRGLQGQPMPRHNVTSGGSVIVAEAPRKVTPKVSEVVTEYDRHEMARWKPRSAQMGREGLRFFVECVGDKPIGDVTRGDLREYQAKLRDRPGRRGEKLSDASITKLQSYVTGLFRWAHDGEIIGDNPAPVILKPMKSAMADDEQRDAFTDADLKVIFGGDFEDNRDASPERYWLPLLMLYTGARNEEIAQLHTRDVREVEGVWVVDINENTPDKTLKNKFSKRLVPLHPALFARGFLSYVEATRAAGHPRLWTALTKGARGYNAPVSRWFNRRLERIGIKTTRKDSYSLRHTFSTKLKRAEIPEYVIDQLTGHKISGISVGRYGKAVDIRQLHEVLRGVTFL